MKKSVIALAVSGLALALASVAHAQPQQGTFYAGAKAGWASFHSDVNQFGSSSANDYANSSIATDAKARNAGKNRNSVTYGVFGGYQVLNVGKFGLGAELAYDYVGRAKQDGTANGSEFLSGRHTAHGVQLSLKPSYEVLPNLDVYGRVGVALLRSDYLYSDNGSTATDKKAHITRPSLALAAGAEYAITPSLAARLEYQWLEGVGNGRKAYDKHGPVATRGQVGSGYDYRPDVGSVSLGLSYRFGQVAAPVAAPVVKPAPVAKPQPQYVTKNFTFSSDVLFDFNKATLKAGAADSLNNAANEIKSLGLDNQQVQVAGYADRLGKDAYNLKLSQSRAGTVANYLASQGVAQNTISAVGYGEANPVTGHTCDNVKGRKQLIACLAPDRRVEVSVQGSKTTQVAM